MDPAEPALPVESYAAWSKTLSAHHYETARAELLYGAALKLISAPGESEGDFRVRLRHRPRELCDTQLTTLNNSYAQARGLAGAPGCRAGR